MTNSGQVNSSVAICVLFKIQNAQDRNLEMDFSINLGRFPLVPFQTSAIFCCLNHVHGHRRPSNVWWRKSSQTCKRRCVNLTEICLRWRRMLQGFGVICPEFMTKSFSLATSSQMARWWSVPSTMAGTIRYRTHFSESGLRDFPFLGSKSKRLKLPPPGPSFSANGDSSAVRSTGGCGPLLVDDLKCCERSLGVLMMVLNWFFSKTNRCQYNMYIIYIIHYTYSIHIVGW